MRIEKLNKRQIIILVALAIPMVCIVMLSFFGSHGAPVHKLLGNADNAIANTRTSITIDQALANVRYRLAQAKALPPAEYFDWRKQDPHLPATLADYIDQIQRRLKHLEKMTPAEWDAEQRQRDAQLRQHGLSAIKIPSIDDASDSIPEPAKAPAKP